MKRHLSPEEETLWAKVKNTVRPLGNKSPPPTVRHLVALTPLPTPPPKERAGSAPHAESLDRSWDRKISSGKLSPDLVIDLHGMTREGARQLLLSRISGAYQQGLRLILVITGKGMRFQNGVAAADLVPGLGGPDSFRGSIKAELPRWLGEQHTSPYIAAVRRAHPRHGGDGAVYLIIRRRRS